tara:strand:- start:446 stop:1882 length:1437 start_codon:yes stop_codon:yes gene_type:complete
MANTKITSDNLDTNIDIAGTLDVTGATTLDAGLTVDTTTLVVDATNNRVGIGNASPQAHLDINTETAEATTVILNGEANQDKILKFRHYANSEAAADGYAGFIGSVVDNVLTLGHFDSSNSEIQVLHVTEGADVGIGTSSPSTKLEVNGGIRLSGLNGGDGLKFDLAGSSDFVMKESSTNDVFQIGALQHNISSNALGIGDAPNVALEVVTSDPRLRLRDNTAGGGSGNGGKIEFGGYHASSSDGARLWAEIHGLKNNSTGGDTHGDLKFLVNTGSVSPSEVGRFNFDGDFLVANVDGVGTWYNGVSGVGFGYSPNGYGAIVRGGTNTPLYVSTNSQGAGGFIEFSQNGAARGSITYNGSSTLYNASSDYRLKENATPIQNALSKINLLNPINFDWKESGDNSDGFLAHEAQTVVPYAVTGVKDEVYTDENSGEEKTNGEPKYQVMDYGKLTPLLVKAIQEQQTIIEDLKARIEALES